jgi:hypothetical protein
VDDGEIHAPAIAWAVEEALRRRECLRIVHVAERAADRPSRGAAAALATAARLAGPSGDLDIHLDTVAGAPRSVLPVLSRQTEAVVLGGRAHRLLGAASLPGRIARRMDGPMVVVPERATEPQRRGSVVVLLPDGRASERLLRFAFEHAALRGGCVTLVPRTERTERGRGSGSATSDGGRWLAEAIARWAAAYPQLPVTVRTVDRRGDDALFAAVHGCALVVTDPGRGRAWARALRRRLTRDLRTEPAWPVAVVP